MEVTKGKGSSLLLFKEVPALGGSIAPQPPMRELFAIAWQRAGRSDLFIDRP
jgi:hypothetical protein